MNVNPDPRPGRWLLPLVVLGMVAFTFIFVDQLPGEGAADDTTTESSTGSTSSTSIPDGSDPAVEGGTTQTTQAPAGETTASPEVTAYRDAMTALGTQLTGLQAELAAANSAWESDGNYGASQDAFTEISGKVADWRDQVTAVSVPGGLTETHNALVEAANQAANQAAAALDGLVNAPGPDKRRNAVAAFDQAVASFTQALATIG
jgi:hypothetical protein